VKFFDGINHPSAATVIADGLDGGMLYLGTPSSGKDLTAAQYRDYKAHGLFVAVGFEHVTTDWQGGAAAGRRNAAAFLADARAKGVDPDDPFWVAIDMHVAARDLPTVVAYVRAYVAGVRAGKWRGRAGVYGFPEVTNALHAARVVDWYWGAGRRADQPAFVNVWQDNTQHVVVGGSSDDLDWVLIPIPTAQEGNVSLTPADAQTIFRAQMPADPSVQPPDHQTAAWQVWRDTLDRTGDNGARLDRLGTAVDELTATIGKLAADVAALKAAQQPAGELTGQATVNVQLNPPAAS
jgi:hypothetical protein